MWLIPSTFSVCSQAPECSTRPSSLPCLYSDFDVEPWVTLSGTPQRRPFSWHGWKQRPWNRRLFGTAASPTWTPVLCGDSLTCSSQAHRANLTRPRESGEETTITGATGTAADRCPTPSESMTSVVPPWDSSRMFLSGGQTGIFNDLVRNFAEWVTTSRRRSSARVATLAGRMEESVGSAWSTADARSMNYGESVDSFEARRSRNLARNSNGNGMGTPLAMQVQQWATPNTCQRGKESTESKESTRGSSTGIDLQTQAAQWPTACAGNSRHSTYQYNKGDSTGASGITLTLCGAAQWPTAMAQDSEQAGSPNANMVTLTRAVTPWPTPKARDAKGETQRGADVPMDALANSAGHFVRPDGRSSTSNWPDTRKAIEQRWHLSESESAELLAPCERGLSSLWLVWTPPTPSRLNPIFQWWLMRWPTPRAICSASGEMEWTRWWRRMRSQLCSLVCGETPAGRTK